MLCIHRQTAEIPANGSVPVVQPLPQPPLRHSKSLQIAPEAQPAALLLVDVLTASNVAGLMAVRSGSEQEQATDIQEMQQVICALSFEDTLNDAETGWPTNVWTFLALHHERKQLLLCLYILSLSMHSCVPHMEVCMLSKLHAHVLSCWCKCQSNASQNINFKHGC